MKIIDQIENILLAECPTSHFTKVEMLINKKMRDALEDEMYKGIGRLYIANTTIEIMPAEIEESWIYLTFYDDFNIVDFRTIDMDRIIIPTSDFMQELDKPVELAKCCSHDWKETLGIFRTYKDCVKCNMKWEDFIK